MKLLLATLHARYSHSSLALPSLAACCSDIDSLQCVIREYTVNDAIDRTLSRIVHEQPDVIGFSCYIWNIRHILQLAGDFKQLFPESLVVLGGPEASCGSFDLMEKNPAIDIIVKDEGEESFRQLMEALARTGFPAPLTDTIGSIDGILFRSGEDIVATGNKAAVADLDLLPSPFASGLADITKPLVYYESSRGCPFSCAFCMSSREQGVRSYSMTRIMSDLTLLMDAGVSTIKFVDRTFNYDARRANTIWQYILEHNGKSRFHFEIAADLLTDDNLRLLRQVPRDTFQFEIGVQSGNSDTLAHVNRHSNLEKIDKRVRELKELTAVTLHLDLVAGLPGEDYEGFIASAGRLLNLLPHHIQVEPLKVLKGTPMRRIAAKHEYLFSQEPPYKILRTPWLPFEHIERIEIFSRMLDLVYNSDRFPAFLHVAQEKLGLEQLFSRLSDFCLATRAPSSLPLNELFALLKAFCSEELSPSVEAPLCDALFYDLCRWDFPSTARRVFPDHETLPLPQKEAVIAHLGTPRESAGRIRSFAARFNRDYRVRPCVEAPIDLLFVYRTGAEGLNVTVTELASLPGHHA